MLYDQIALENHDYIATKAQRIQNSKHWVLSINADGPLPPRQQRPDYAAAKRECQRLQDELHGGNKAVLQTNERSEDCDYVVENTKH